MCFFCEIEITKTKQMPLVGKTLTFYGLLQVSPRCLEIAEDAEVSQRLGLQLRQLHTFCGRFAELQHPQRVQLQVQVRIGTEIQKPASG